MILAPASVWVARDGSHCRVNGGTLTTHSMADKFQDFVLRERLYDTLGSLSLGPTRSYVLSHIPESQIQFKDILQGWLAWAFRETSISSCLVESRGGILQGTLQRKYLGHREPAVLAALKVGNEKRYEEDPTLVGGLAVTLWNQLIQAEGGRIFDNIQPKATPLTDMLPTSAHLVNLFRGTREVCTGWELKGNGELFIPQGSLIGKFSNRNATEYQMADKTILGGDLRDVVKGHLSTKGIDIKHVRFVLIGFQPPHQKLGNGAFECSGIRGVILVTLSRGVYGDACRWHKAGMFFSRDFRREHLKHDIVVTAA